MQDSKAQLNLKTSTIPLKIAGGPGRYVQGIGALDRIGSILKDFGEKPLIVSDDVVWSILGARVSEGIGKSGMKPFGGECSHSEIDRISAL